jgi:hypothetical protein
MRVKVQIVLDDGTRVVDYDGDATRAGGWSSTLGVGPVLEGEHKLYGFTYLPEPPPRDPFDSAEFHRLCQKYLI